MLQNSSLGLINSLWNSQLLAMYNSCGGAFGAFLAGIWSRVPHSQSGLCLFSRIYTGRIDGLQMVVVVFLGKLPLVKMSLMDVGEEFLSHITPSPFAVWMQQGRLQREAAERRLNDSTFLFFKRQRKGVQARLDYFQSHCTCVDSPLSAATSSLQRARGRAGTAVALSTVCITQ